MMRRGIQSLIWTGAGVLLGMALFLARPTAHAYPEYTDRTGEQCTGCHVNPAGGGPRTLRGLLWIAEGRPDTVPPLPGGEAAAGEELDGPALYQQFECARCHGAVGEGGVAAALNQTEWTEEQLQDILRNGIEAMNGYPPNVMSDEAMQTLIPYVQAIGRGEIEQTVFLQKRLLPPPRLGCSETISQTVRTDCGGN